MITNELLVKGRKQFGPIFEKIAFFIGEELSYHVNDATEALDILTDLAEGKR